MATISIPNKPEPAIPARVHISSLSPDLESLQHEYPYQPPLPLPPQPAQSAPPDQGGKTTNTVSEEWWFGSKKKAARCYLGYVLVWFVLVVIMGVVVGVCVRFA